MNWWYDALWHFGYCEELGTACTTLSYKYPLVLLFHSFPLIFLFLSLSFSPPLCILLSLSLGHRSHLLYNTTIAFKMDAVRNRRIQRVKGIHFALQTSTSSRYHSLSD